MKINVVYPQKFASIFGTWSLAIVDCLNVLRYDANIRHQINFDSCDIEIIQCPLYYELFEKKHYKKYIMIQGEQFPTIQHTSKWQKSKWDRIRKFLHCYDIVWDTYNTYHSHLYENITSVQYNIGYHPLFDKYENVEKKYDISFFGTLNDRRVDLINRIGNVEINQNITGFERDLFINQSKINLNIHYSESKLLQTLRILYCACSKGCIISEDFIGDEDLRDRMINIDKDNLPDMVVYLLNSESVRNEVTEDVYNYFKNKRTMINGIKECF
jgi:hypothetical protein